MYLMQHVANQFQAVSIDVEAKCFSQFHFDECLWSGTSTILIKITNLTKSNQWGW